MAETKEIEEQIHQAEPVVDDFLYDAKDSRMLLNFGPSHPATHGTLRLILELEGEIVVKCTPDLGFLHHGFEKLGEYRSYNQVVTITDRMNYLSPMNNNFAYILAIEELFELEIPKRAQYFRVILAELSRIMDHLLNIATQAMDLGAFTALLYLFREREDIYNLFELITGTRLTISYVRLGGFAVDRDIPEEFFTNLQKFLTGLPNTLEDVDNLLSHNQIWLNRTKDVGVITKEDAIKYAITGPCLRASGIPLDIRITQPYSSYEDFDFDIPVGESGDVYDRYLVRMEEMKQAVRIIQQAVENLPEGEMNVDSNSKVTLPSKDEVYGSIEGLIHQFEIIMENRGALAPVGESYVATESPNGELGFFVISNKGRGPYRFRVRPPSFYHYQILPSLVEGYMLSDLVAVLSSLNLIACELDR